MPRKGMDSRMRARPGRSEFMEMPDLCSNSNAVNIRRFSIHELHVETKRRDRKPRQGENKPKKASGIHLTSEYSRTHPHSIQSSLSCLSQGGSFLMADETKSYSRGEHVERSVSHQPGSFVASAVHSGYKGKDKQSKRQVRPLADAADSIEISKKSLKLKSRNAEDVKCTRQYAEIEGYYQQKSSKKDSRRSKCSALETKSHSQSMYMSETVGQCSLTSLTSLDTHKCEVKCKACACMLFAPKTGAPTDARVTEDRKKDKKGRIYSQQRKEKERRTIEKKTKDDKRKSGKKSHEERTKHHSEFTNCKTSERDRQVKASQSRSKRSENQDRKNNKCASSKNVTKRC